MDEKGFAESVFLNLQVGDPFRAKLGSVATLLVTGKRRRSAVLGVDGGLEVGDERVVINVPVLEFGISVPKVLGVTDILRVEKVAVGLVEGSERSVDVLHGAGTGEEGTVVVLDGDDVRIRVEVLPDGKGTVDVGVVEEKDGVKSAVVDHGHVTAVAHQTVDLVVNGLDRIVAGSGIGLDPSLVGKVLVFVILSEQVVKTVAVGFSSE